MHFLSTASLNQNELMKNDECVARFMKPRQGEQRKGRMNSIKMIGEDEIIQLPR